MHFWKGEKRESKRLVRLAALFLSSKNHLLNGSLLYGRVFNYIFERFSQRFRGVCVVLRFCLWLLLGISPFPLLAEWSSSDRETLSNINYNVSLMDDHLVQTYLQVQNFQTWLHNYLGYSSNSSWSGNTLHKDLLSLYDSVNSINTDLGFSSTETLKSKLDTIISLLENNSGSGSGDVSGVTEDWLTEDTFTNKFDGFTSKYEELANRAYNAFGFTQEETFKDYLNEFFFPAKNGFYQSVVFSEESDWDTEPFPNEGHGWGNYYTGLNEFGTNRNIVSVLSEILASDLEAVLDGLTYNFKKESWNDWYAHTNLVSQIALQVDRIVLPPNNPPSLPSFDANNGSISIPSSSGGSSTPDTIDLKPSFTNDFAVIEQDRNSVTNSFNFVEANKIKQRYYVEGILDGGSYHDYESYGNSFNTVIRMGGIDIDLNEGFSKYRLIVSVDNLEKLRSAMGYIWLFSSILSSFWFAVKIAGISKDGGE